MRYENLPAISRDDAVKALETQDRDTVSRTLVQLALHEKDRPWLEAVLVRFMQNGDPWIRGVAATCAGHVARIHRQLDQKTIRPLLEVLLNDPATARKARDALDDIEIFITQSE